MYRVIWEDKEGFQECLDWVEDVSFACDQLTSKVLCTEDGWFSWIQIETKGVE